MSGQPPRIYWRSTMLAACLVTALAGCGESDQGVGGVSAGEARALNDAAEMLDARNTGAISKAPDGSTPSNSGAAQ